ncbi:unnamed protein product, partial [Scytosiphon promiscuus]
PGDTILLEDGEYWEDVKTRVDGTSSEKITIRGAGGTSNRDNVILRGAGNSLRMLQIMHDHYVIEDFMIDGDVSDVVESDDFKELYRAILIFATAGREPTEREGGYTSALDGLVIRNMRLANAGSECVRLRDFVTFAEVHDNYITDCGIYDYRHEDGGKNGEGVYIGTSSNQWGDGKNWSDAPDECRGNVVRQNYIRTRGNEGIDVKEGSYDTLIAENEVYMQFDDDSGGIGSRADRSIIRDNHIEDADGAGVRLGGHLVNGYQYGVNNQVYGNTIRDCRHSGLKIMVSPQDKICGNDIEVPRGVDEEDYQISSGTFGQEYDPAGPCGPTPSPAPTPGPTPQPITPAPTPPTTLGGPTPAPTPSPESPAKTCSNGIPGIDGNGVVCCPLGCNQCGGPGCSTSGRAAGLGSDSCCGGGVKASGEYCDDTGAAPCIIGSGTGFQPIASQTCSNGIPGIDGNGVVCCPLGCNQCGGPGCSTSGRAAGLGSDSCCGGGVKASGKFCDDTGAAPCIIGSGECLQTVPFALRLPQTCSNGIPGIDGNGVVCCPLGCNQCGGPGCSTSGRAAGLGSDSCCGGGVKASGKYCDDTGAAPCIIGSGESIFTSLSAINPPLRSSNTCSNGIPGIDGNGVVCCPLGCKQCGGPGCSTSGRAAGLGSDSCCGGGVKASGKYCEDTGVAPCII